MRILTGYMPATEGRATVAGYDVFENPLEAKRRTGYLPETPPLYPDMTVREYLQFVARIKMSGITAAQRRARIAAVMERTRITDVADRHCAKLSKGYRQRVGIAQALVNEPEVIFLDEPMSGLDPLGRREVRELILRLRNEGRTVFFSSHILSDAETLCSRVAILAGGRLRASGALGDMLAFEVRGWEIVVSGIAPDACATAGIAVTRVSPIASDRCALELPPEVDPQQAVAALKPYGARLISINPVRETLEDLFVREVARPEAQR
jgi:ABC-2 type transport system ATP-binding protein